MERWITALQNVVRMVFEREKSEGHDPECVIYDSVFTRLCLDPVSGQPCAGVVCTTPIDAFGDEFRVSDTVVVLVDHPSVVRDAKFKYSGSRRAIVVSSSGTGISGCSETFHIDRLQLCVIDHRLYAPHRRVMGEERARILARFGSNLTTYPKLTIGDPIVRFFGWEVDDLVEITVSDVPDDMMSIKYRVVAHASE